eukprot:CAMPEP_0170512730 /NCGR_PEP_ID=MMETSP0208-20121228/67011_1 /TAXON_ID=197538 /ORGANISM="Strombidium inclinatum, Strain S3" /LENGTH=53 /DNA_ID=CAMNT_0010796391 /DNA_START=2767 /DNA_END=2928 /DNA_ORIENTATION=+
MALPETLPVAPLPAHLLTESQARPNEQEARPEKEAARAEGLKEEKDEEMPPAA